MSESIEYRIVGPSDYAAMHVLMNQFRSNSPFTQAEYEEFLQSTASHMQVWGLFLSGELVATAKLIFEKKLIFKMATLAHIEDVCTLESHRKKGYGTLLLKHIIQVAKEANCYKITLCCSEPLSEFYATSGFETRGVQMSQLL